MKPDVRDPGAGADDLRSVRFERKDTPLRDDVRRLGALVGAVLRDQSDDGLFPLVEEVRRAAIGRRESPTGECAGLEGLLTDRTPGEANDLVRAFSTYFQVVNLAEQVHRIRRGRSYLMEGATPQTGSLAEVLRRLADDGVPEEETLRLIAEASVEPVFTAHPTEATRRVVLEKQARIAKRLLERLNPSRTVREDRVSLARIRAELTTAWQTEEHPRIRPSVADEREHVLYYVAGVIYRVLPALHEALEEAWAEAYGTDRAIPDRPLLRVASWVGGDMDGNPSAGPDTIRAALARHRSLVLARYAEEVLGLARELTQSETRTSWSDDVQERIDDYGARFPEAEQALGARSNRMGYRVFLHLVGARLQATERDDPEGYPSPGRFVEDLRAIEESLDANRGRHAGLFTVRRLRRRAETFGFHLATLDVRQDAREHRDAIAALLRDPSWQRRTPEDRAERLRAILSGGHLDELDPDQEDPTLARALAVFAAIHECRQRYGRNAVGPFVISMAQGVDDVLSVLLLAMVGGLADEHGSVPLDVAPLFETVSDLENARATLGRLYADPIYGPHLARREDRQMVMVGYSDSSKDGGIASARWSLQRAQREMAAVSADADVRLTVFHGRGGTVSRGGGKVYRAVEASPAAALSGRLRLTEQGEVIDAKYGLPSIALRNLERMLGAVVLKGAEATRGGPRWDPAWAEIGDVLADESRRAYRRLVYEDPRFHTFFRNATPIDAIERMTIGSRPAARRGRRGIEDLRAIPWVFAWTQTRAGLPGWFGLGSGLEAAVARFGAETLGGAVRDWPFLSVLVDDVEMVLAKSDLAIAERYVRLAPPETHAVFDAIRSEFERTVGLVLSLKATDEVLSGDATLQRSIRLRNPYVDPMNLLQIDLLSRWRAGGREDDDVFAALLASIQGIARGLKNTG